MLDMLSLHERRAERRYDLGRAFNIAVETEGFTLDERSDDAFVIFAGDWAEDNVHPDDLHWFGRTCDFGYPEFDGWTPDVDDEKWPEIYDGDGLLTAWNPSDWQPPFITSDN